MPHIAVIDENPNATVIEADPAFCTFIASAPLGKLSAAAPGALGLNVNYTDETDKIPFGILIDRGQRLSSVPPHDRRRTALVLSGGKAAITPPLSRADEATLLPQWVSAGATVIQAGPRLLKEGEEVMSEFFQIEGFAGDVIRQTRHVAIGINKAGKLLVLYTEDRTLAAATEILQGFGAVDALNCDGGHLAHLSLDQIKRGTSTPDTLLTMIPATGG